MNQEDLLLKSDEWDFATIRIKADDASCTPILERFERNIFMKKIIAAILVLTLVFSVASAAIAGDVNFNNVPIHYPQILDAWNASNSDELYHHILEYWQASATEYPQAFTAKHQPLSIKIGGNTKELIAEKSKWDLAIVSSKDVDLQALANEKLIMSTGNNPSNVFALHQWLLPEKMIHLLPKDPLMLYYIYIYDYDIQLDEATFIICQDNIGRKRNHPRGPDEFAAEIMQRRSVNAVRTLE
ncbi:MAG: hypothetical protein RR085_03840, partial [Clostridia bacterium]